MTRVTPAFALMAAVRKAVGEHATVLSVDGGDRSGDEFEIVLSVDDTMAVRVAGRIPARGDRSNVVDVSVGTDYGTIAGRTAASVPVGVDTGQGEHHYRVRSSQMVRSHDVPGAAGVLLGAAGGAAIGLDRLALVATGSIE